MAISLIVPTSIEAIIQKFDATTTPFNEFVVSGEVGVARAALQTPTEEEQLGAWSEVLAFALAGRHFDSPWDTYFGPMSSSETTDGKTIYFPSIEGTPPEVVAHWSKRARTLKHPFLRARYADLTWDMIGPISKGKRDVEDARIAIDSYLAAAPMMAELYNKLYSVERAMDLAILIRDLERTTSARHALMAMFRAAIAEPPGMWWVVFDRLIDEKRAGVTDKERDELIAGVESLIALHADQNQKDKFDPHACKEAVLHLLPIYKREQNYDGIMHLNETVARTFEYTASLADAMLAASFLQTSWDFYRSAQLNDDARRVRILMQKAIGDSKVAMKKISHEITITKNDIDTFVSKVIVDELGDSLANIAYEFMLKRDVLEKEVKETAVAAPLSAHITQEIMADDRVVAKIGSVKDDLFGRVFVQAKFTFSFSAPWLSRTYDQLFKKHQIVPESMASWANRHKLFNDMGLLIQGIHGWLQGDNVKAAHLLVPQVEHALRKIAGDIGLPVTKAHPRVKGVSVAINMGDILSTPEILAALGENLTLHFQALYSDPRGLNLRNRMAHGLMDSSDFGDHMSGLIIHSLLMLGVWKELGNTAC
jgi:Domain of unknown function (DUF4209)